MPLDNVTLYRYTQPMYNKLFTKILDSSIWLESDTTRIVWLTCIAAMDQDGFVQFASVPNLAHRANVPVPAAEAAVGILEAPDANSSDPDYEGRRLERVPGGWLVLNAQKYRELVTRMASREMVRQRVSRHREKKRICNGLKRSGNAPVTQSEAYTDAEAETENTISAFERFWAVYPKKKGKDAAKKAFEKRRPSASLVTEMIRVVERQRSEPQWQKDGGQFIPHPATWLNEGRWQDAPEAPAVPQLSKRTNQILAAVQAIQERGE